VTSRSDRCSTAVVVRCGARELRVARIIVLVAFTLAAEVGDESRDMSATATPRRSVLTLVEAAIIEHFYDGEREPVVFDGRQERRVTSEISLQICNPVLWRRPIDPLGAR